MENLAENSFESLHLDHVLFRIAPPGVSGKTIIRHDRYVNVTGGKFPSRNPHFRAQTGVWSLSHLCHTNHPESISSGLAGEGTRQGLGSGIELFNRADPLAFDINNPVLTHHGRGSAGQSAELDLFLGQGRWSHLGRRSCNGTDASRQRISLTLSVAGADGKTVFTVG